MRQTITRSALVCVLIISLAGVAFTQSSPQSKPANQFLTKPEASSTAKSNEKLKSDVAKMVAETKAGRKGVPTSQFPMPQRNNLSKTAKIAIVAGIVLVVIAIIIVHEVRELHCESRCVL
jgi:Flp pilus assembly protein TadB